jgi:putative ABC transport system permease protein
MLLLFSARLAWRTARRDPRQSFTIVATIALAVCGLAATGAVVDALWLRPLPFAESGRLAVVYSLPPNATLRDRNPLRSPDFVEFRERLRGSLHLSGVALRERAVRVSAEPSPYRVGHVSANFFDLLQVQPARGRVFSEADDQHRAPVAVLSDGMWRSAFGGDAGVIGRSVVIDGEPHTIVGVMPEHLDLAFAPADLWVPLGVSRSHQPLPNATYIIGLGRLQPGISLRQADLEASATMDQLGRERPVTQRGWRAGTLSLREFQFGDQRRVVLVLFAAAALLFAIATLNVLNATLAAALSRSRSLRTAVALGAEPRHLMCQQLVLTLGLVAAGGALGLYMARSLLTLLGSLDPDWIRQSSSPAIDWRTYVLVILAAVAAGTAAGVAAVRRALGQTIAATGERVTGSKRDRRLRRALSAVQVCVVVVLVAAAISIGTAFQRAVRLAPGFEAEGVLATQLRMPTSLYATRERRAEALTAFLERIRALPGVESAGATTNAFEPGNGIATLVQVEGRPAPDGSPHVTQVRYVSPDYFRTLKIPLLAGRPIDATDTATAPMAAVVSRALVRRFWGGGDAVGRRLTRHVGDMPPFTVVGVAADVSDVRIGQPSEGILYLPYSQINFEVAPISVVVRAAGPPETLAPVVRAAILAVNPNQPIYRVGPLTRFARTSLSPQRFRTSILAVMAGIGLLLAAAGLHAVVGRSIVDRLREIAIRRALGASRVHVCLVALSDAALSSLAGGGAGVLLALAAASRFRALVPEGRLAAPEALAGALGIVFLTIAIVTLSLLPRVLRVDAAATLRSE